MKSDAKFEEKLTCGLENYMRNLANFHQGTWKCQNWEFDRIFLSKVENAWTKNLQRSYVSWQWRMMQNFWEELTCCFKIDMRNLRNLTWAWGSPKNLHFNGLFSTKVYNISVKKYSGAIFHDTEEWYKIWRNTDLWFGKWQEEFGNFSPEHLEVSKLGLWGDPFIQNRKCVRLKFA